MPEGKLIEVSMVRDSLEGLPDFPLPAPYTIRGYQPGDVATWVKVHREAERYHDISEALFHREFGRDEGLLAQRQLFLCDGAGAAIGTATAWFHDDYRGLPHGRIHWVAIAERMQGRGLGRPLIAALCRRLVELGHARAYLTTETVRVRAIHLYRQFGFVPELKNEADVAAWRELRHA